MVKAKENIKTVSAPITRMASLSVFKLGFICYLYSLIPSAFIATILYNIGRRGGDNITILAMGFTVAIILLMSLFSLLLGHIIISKIFPNSTGILMHFKVQTEEENNKAQQ